MLYLPNKHKKSFYRLLFVIVLLFAITLNISSQINSFIQSNIYDSLYNYQQYSQNEKELFWAIKTSDSLSKTDVVKAYDYIRRAKILLTNEKVNNKLLSFYLHVYGKILIDNHKINKGIDTLKMVIDLKTRIYGANDQHLAKTHNYLGIAHFKAHQYEEALSDYLRSIEILEMNSVYNRDLFDALLNVGIVKASQGSYDLAYKYFKRASEIIDSPGSPDSLSIAQFYNNYGLLATFMGKTELANKYFDKAEKFYVSLLGEKHTKLASLNLNKGVNAFNNLNYPMSRLYYDRAVDIYLESNQTGSGFIKSLNNLSVVNRELGLYSESIAYAEKALNYSPSKDMRIVLYLTISKTYELLNDNEKQEKVLKKALKLVESPETNPKRVVDVYLLYADFLKSYSPGGEEFTYYKKALNIEGELNGFKTAKYAMILSKIGDYYSQKDDEIEMSLIYFDRAIKIWQNYLGISKSGNLNNGFHDLRFVGAYHGKSLALIKKYELEGDINNLFSSLDNYEWLLKQLEHISRSLQKDNQKIIREQIFPIYNEVIKLSYKLFNITSNNYFQEKTFEFSEKSKSAILLASIRNSTALRTSDIGQVTLKLDQDLNEEINAVKKQLFEEKQKSKPKKKKLDFFGSRLMMLLKKHDSLITQLEKNNPKYYSLKYDISVIKLGDLYKRLSGNEVLLEYQMMDSKLYIFVLRNNKLYMKEVLLDSSFYESARYITNLKNMDLTTENRYDFANFVKHSKNMYSFLIQPVEEQVRDKRLLIIPSGILGYLPFEILVKPKSIVEGLDYRDLDYLIKDHPVSYSYSSTLRFGSLFNNTSFKSNIDILYMAPHYHPDKDSRTAMKLPGLKELPFAKSEVEGLQREFGGKVYSGSSALKSKFLETAAGYDVLHLAMHTLINDTMPLYSKLVFAPEGGEDDKVFLNTSEIYEMNLKALMVTLSACNTGKGVLQKGEGIMSLARGFVFAGVPSVVMTLWEVQDESGQQIMESFYEYLSLGYEKDIAMQMAKLKVLRNSNMIKSHPNYWSAYIITGDTSALKVGNKNNSLWLMLIFVIPAFLGFFVYKRIVSKVKY